MFGAQPDDLRLWVETGERWQAQDLNTAEAAKKHGHPGAGR